MLVDVPLYGVGIFFQTGVGCMVELYAEEPAKKTYPF